MCDTDPELTEDAYLLAMVRKGSKGRKGLNQVIAGQLASAAWESELSTPGLFDLDSEVARAARDLKEWRDCGIEYTSFCRHDYPSLLRSAYDAPAFLFYRGKISLLSQNQCIAVVGSRNAPANMMGLVQEVTRIAKDKELVVASGLARGVDAMAHQSVLDLGCAPAGVIATPIEGPYSPAANRGLHEAVASSGVLVSQFHPGVNVRKHNFIARNATMSGLSMVTVVIYAEEKSGTLHQVNAALRHGRKVLLSKVVTRTTSWGSNLARKHPEVTVIDSSAQFSTALDQICNEFKPGEISALLGFDGS